MLPSTSFFKSTAYHSQQNAPIEYSYIDVGGEAFHALAVAFIDNFKKGAQLNDLSVKKILEAFWISFPEYHVNQAYMTPVERMRALFNSSRKSELVECLAYVLRQLTVDAIFANPLAYSETFRNVSAQVSKDHFLLMNTPIPVTSLAALTEQLDFTLALSFKDLGKELRRLQVFQSRSGTSHFEIELQIQGARYYPKVKHKNDFAYIGQLAIAAPKAVANSSGEQDITAILESIASADKLLWGSYNEYRKILLNMLAAKELTKEMLVNLYIKFLPQESSTQRFIPLEQHTPRVAGEVFVSLEDQTSNLLVEALARELSLKHINSDYFFEQIEGPMQQSYTLS